MTTEPVLPSPPETPLAGPAHVRTLLILLVAALALFTARIGDLSLPSLEDAFYAREAVEMLRSGRAYTVTWNEIPTHQHPPLHLWLVSRAFAALGESDLAARLPTVILALGTLLVTYRIGVLTVGAAGAMTGVALLVATPFFVDHARRVMMEVPLTFWTVSTVWIYLEAAARGRPRWQIALALPLGAAILTKSVLGLIPLLALAGVLVDPERRAGLRRPWAWLGIGLGLALGASWPVHQWLTQGPGAVESHFLAHVVRRASGRRDLMAILKGYPRYLLKFYQPVVIPALAGLWLLLRRPGPLRARGAVLAAWILLPVALYSFSAYRTPRFIFPVVPALALAAGHAVAVVAPRLAALLATRLVPAAALAVAAVLWLVPAVIVDDNVAFKRQAGAMRAVMAEGESVPYLGEHYWKMANPLLYYTERHLGPARRTVEEALPDARAYPGRLLFATRRRLPDLAAQRVTYEVVAEGPDWALLRLTGG